MSKIAIPPPSAATDGPRLADRLREAGHEIVVTDRWTDAGRTVGLVGYGHSIGHNLESGPTGVQMAFDNIDRALRGELPESVINQEIIPAWRRRVSMLAPLS